MNRAGSVSTTCRASKAMAPGRPTRSPSWRTYCSRLNSIARLGHAGFTSLAWRHTRVCRRRICRSLDRGWDTKVSGRVADCSSYVGSDSRPRAEHCPPCTPQRRRRLSAGASTDPNGPGQLRGNPTRVLPAPGALDEQIAQRLWEASERLTGIRFQWMDPSADIPDRPPHAPKGVPDTGRPS
jgi:hypothetical protein